MEEQDYSHEVPDPRPVTSEKQPMRGFGKDWCPKCEGELVQSGGYWHHIFGERNGCPWTD